MAFAVTSSKALPATSAALHTLLVSSVSRTDALTMPWSLKDALTMLAVNLSRSAVLGKLAQPAIKAKAAAAIRSFLD